MGGRCGAARLAVLLGLVLALLGGAPAAVAQQGVLDPLSAPGVLVSASAAPPPVVTATGWIVADLDDADVLAAGNARTPLAPASTIKLLTALALAPDLPDDQVWTGTHDAAAVDGSKVGVVPGSTYTVDDLLHGLLLGSGNDCAQALSELAGGIPEATAEMESVAAGLGATDTVVGGTSGLDAPGQVTSARDLALIGRAVLAEPRLAELVATPRYAFPGPGTTFGPERPRFEVGNHNRLLARYPGALGLKNGYTDAARGSFVGAAERDGRRYVVAVLQAEGPTWQHAAALLDWAFATPADLPAVGSLDPSPDEAPAVLGAPPQLPVGDGAAVSASHPSGASVERTWWQGLPGPVRAVGVLLGLLVAAVVVLRARVLLLRR